jgi:hypothetical protein
MLISEAAFSILDPVAGFEVPFFFGFLTVFC